MRYFIMVFIGFMSLVMLLYLTYVDTHHETKDFYNLRLDSARVVDVYINYEMNARSELVVRDKDRTIKFLSFKTFYGYELVDSITKGDLIFKLEKSYDFDYISARDRQRHSARYLIE